MAATSLAVTEECQTLTNQLFDDRPHLIEPTKRVTFYVVLAAPR